MTEVTVLENGNILVSIPIVLHESGGRKKILTDEKNSRRMTIRLY